jgi:hypothetical protein
MNGLNMVGVLQKKSKTFDEIKSREYKLILADSSAKLVDSARGGHEAEIPSEITVGRHYDSRPRRLNKTPARFGW